MVRKRQLPMEERQTIITFESVSFSYREIAKKVKVSASMVSFTIKRHWETGGNDDRKPQQNQKTGFWESTACLLGGSQDHSFKHSLIAVVGTSQFRLWREDFMLQVLQVDLQHESHQKAKTSEWEKEACLSHETSPIDYWRLEEGVMDWWTKILNIQFITEDLSKRMVRQCVTSAFKHGGGSIMFCGCFAGDLYSVREWEAHPENALKPHRAGFGWTGKKSKSKATYKCHTFNITHCQHYSLWK